jgi:ATP-dependent exoDNAse (exonuclease V) alpha subunit
MSTRRSQIEEALGHQPASAKASEAATLATRTVKGHIARNVLHDAWQATAMRHGFGLDEINACLGVANPLDEKAIQKALRIVVQDGIVECQKATGAFGARDLVRYAAEQAQGLGIDSTRLCEGVEKALSQSESLASGIGKDGRLRYASHDTLAVERFLLDAIDRSPTRDKHRVPEKIVNDAIGSHPNFTEEQKDGFRRITTAAGSIQCVTGLAGTGKTSLLEAAREAWERAGYTVIGCALAGKAVRSLESGSGILSETLDRVLWGISKTIGDIFQHDMRQLVRAASKYPTFVFEQDKLTRDTIVVLDEAGMVDTKRLTALVTACEKAGAKLVAVGDASQLQPIEAGGGFRAMVERLGSATLTTIVRQTEEWLRDAVHQFAEGQTKQALTQFALADRLHLSESHDETKRALIESWSEHRTPELKDTLILTSTIADSKALNSLAQEERLRKRELSVSTRFKVGDSQFHLGDRIIFTQKDRSLGVENGDMGTIEKVWHPRLFARGLTVRLDREKETFLGTRPVRIDLDTSKYKHLELAYAVTTHKAQGATVQRAFALVGDFVDKFLTYVQVSRATEDTRIFATKSASGEAVTELAEKMRQGHHAELATHQLNPSEERQRHRLRHREAL